MLLAKNSIEERPGVEYVNWWDLPEWINLRLIQFPDEIKRIGSLVIVRRLKEIRQKEKITHQISGIKRARSCRDVFSLKFPIHLNKLSYAKLYALMTSEGSYRTEFALHVPEEEFHLLLKECITDLISTEAAGLIRTELHKGVLRSRAPGILRYLIPLPENIPDIILKNKNFAREYLKVAFEAEGSPIINKTHHKRYIKLSRYVDITQYVSEENLPLKIRIYKNTIKEKYPELFDKIKNLPPNLLKGEQFLLKHHFNVDSTLNLEAIRKNQTSLRRGKMTARWVLFIYADNIDKFIREVGFISQRKMAKLEEMKEIKGTRPKYSTLEIIRKIRNQQGYFFTSQFIVEMRKLGYKSPGCFLSRFCSNRFVVKVKRGLHKALF